MVVGKDNHVAVNRHATKHNFDIHQDRNNNNNNKNNNNNNNYKRPLVELLLHQPRPFPKLDYHHTPGLAAAAVTAFRQGLILPLRGPSDDCLVKPLPEVIEEAERLARVYRGGTALHAAVCLRRLEAVRLLLRAGGEECKEVDDLDRGVKPLYFCLREGKDKDDTVMALILNGVDMER